MADQSISCPSCGRKIPLTRALRAEIEASVKQRFDTTLEQRELDLRAAYEKRLDEERHDSVRAPLGQRKRRWRSMWRPFEIN